MPPQPATVGAASISAPSLSHDVQPEASGPVLSVLLALMAWADQLNATEGAAQAGAAGVRMGAAAGLLAALLG